jgi:hypothetical protein
MPTISSFCGIVIVMHTRDHNPPHVHAITQEQDAPFLISTGELLEGDFPPKGKAMVREFILANQKELEEMWEHKQYIKLPPIE